MRKATIWFLGIALLIILIWDLVAYIVGKNATISVIITDSSYYTPWIPFAVGFLCGHLFAPAKRSN